MDNGPLPPVVVVVVVHLDANVVNAPSKDYLVRPSLHPSLEHLSFMVWQYFNSL